METYSNSFSRNVEKYAQIVQYLKKSSWKFIKLNAINKTKLQREENPKTNLKFITQDSCNTHHVNIRFRFV